MLKASCVQTRPQPFTCLVSRDLHGSGHSLLLLPTVYRWADRQKELGELTQVLTQPNGSNIKYKSLISEMAYFIILLTNLLPFVNFTYFIHLGLMITSGLVGDFSGLFSPWSTLKVSLPQPPSVLWLPNASTNTDKIYKGHDKAEI